MTSLHVGGLQHPWRNYFPSLLRHCVATQNNILSRRTPSGIFCFFFGGGGERGDAPSFAVGVELVAIEYSAFTIFLKPVGHVALPCNRHLGLVRRMGEGGEAQVDRPRIVDISGASTSRTSPRPLIACKIPIHVNHILFPASFQLPTTKNQEGEREGVANRGQPLLEEVDPCVGLQGQVALVRESGRHGSKFQFERREPLADP